MPRRCGLAVVLVVALATQAAWAGLPSGADLGIVMQASPLHPQVQDTVSLRITVTNHGPGTATGVEVTDILPGGLRLLDVHHPAGLSYDAAWGRWAVGALAEGAHVVLTTRAVMQAYGQVEHCATVASSARDATPGNDQHCILLDPARAAASWQVIQSGTEVIRSIVGIRTTLLAATANGVFRSQDNGENWFPIALQGLDGYALVSDPHRKGRVYAGVQGGSGIYRTDDAGTRWVGLHGLPDTQVRALALNPYDPVHPSGQPDLWVGTADGQVFLSTTDGATWDAVTGGAFSGDAAVLSLFVSDGHPQDIVYMGTAGEGVYRYVYGGAGWEALSDGPMEGQTVWALHEDDQGRIYAGTDEAVLYSDDGGQSWHLALDQVKVYAITEAQTSSGDVLYAGTGGDHLYQSTDRGLTWMRTNDGLGRYVRALWTGDTGHLFAGTDDEGLARSADQGVTFRRLTGFNLHTEVQTLAHSPDGRRLYGGTFGYGVILTEDDPSRGQEVRWMKINNGIQNRQIYALLNYNDPQGRGVLLAGTWQSGLYRSSDGGETWHFGGLPDRIIYALAHCADNNIVWAASDRGEVARSVDNGLSWGGVGIAATPIWSLTVPQGLGCLEVYAGTFGAGIYKTTDGGASWTPTGLRHGYVFEIATDGPGGRLFAATATGVHVSADAGATWQTMNTGLTVIDIRGVATLPTADPQRPILVAATWGDGIYVYDWEDGRWARDGLAGQPVQHVVLHPANGEVFATTQDGTVYHKPFATAVTGVGVAPAVDHPRAVALHPNYPNPFNPTTTITFDVQRAMPVRLVVHDVLGRTLAVLAEGLHPAGTHTVRFDAQGYPAGLYFYRMESPTGRHTRSMMLLK